MRSKKIQILKNVNGDTIIEVMLSMALLTAFLFISWGITNKATQIGINSRKRVEMVNAMKEQAEIIKAQYVKQGTNANNIANGTTSSVSGDLNLNPCDDTGVSDLNSFKYTPEASSIAKEPGKKLMPDANNALWVQYLNPSGGGVPEYLDFYIRACWQTVGSTQNTDSSQFIVRLNNLTNVSATPPVVPPCQPDEILVGGVCTKQQYADPENASCVNPASYPPTITHTLETQQLPSTNPARYKYRCTQNIDNKYPPVIAPTVSCSSPYTVHSDPVNYWKWCETP